MHYLSVQILLHSYFLHYTKFRSINEYEDTSQLQVTHKSPFLKSHYEVTSPDCQRIDVPGLMQQLPLAIGLRSGL